MPYAQAYRLQAISKNGWLISCYIYDKEQDIDNPLDINTATFPFVNNILASNDNPFEPIVAQTVTVNVDMTDFETAWPDFSSLDDKRYYCEILASKSGSEIFLFRGYIINDNVRIAFTTGRQILTFEIVDGLAMLKDIEFTPDDEDINSTMTLLRIMQSCVNKLTFPYNGLNFIVALSYYADGMLDRNDGSEYEPFSQTYVSVRNYLESDYSYMSCWDVLENIMISWGAKLFFRNGEICVIGANELAQDGVDYTQYDEDGVVIDSGLYTALDRYIEHYVSETATPIYFIDNSQIKILRKGYKSIRLKHSFGYAPQLIDNGNLERLTAGLYSNWTTTAFSTGASVTQVTLGNRPAYLLNAGTNVNTSYAYITPLSIAPIFSGLTLSLSFNLSVSGSTSAPAIYIVMRLSFAGGVPNYALNQDGEWELNGADYYRVARQNNDTNRITVDTPPTPIAGTLLIRFYVRNGDSSDPIPEPGTSLDAYISNIVLTADNDQDYKLVAANKDDENYQYEVNIPAGQQADGNTTVNGVYMKSDGTTWGDWYRFGITENFTSLMRLVLQQYVNIFASGLINMDGSIRTIIPPDGDLNMLISMRADDPTGTTLSVSGKKYMFGNGKFDYINDVYSGYLIETKNTEVITGITITDEVILDNNL